MSLINDFLRTTGICEVPEIYTQDEIAAINALIDPLLEKRLEERRAYVHVDELQELGLLGTVLSDRMKDTLFSIIPDPVLYHCHVYEIAANDSRPHIFADSLTGWHRDRDSDYVESDSTHVSIFIYLSNVGPDDGAFEFIPSVPPTKWLRNGARYISVQGPAGFSFAWHRKFYHRASPNRGPTRRRLLKLSVQRNSFFSPHLGNPHFQKAIAGIAEGDVKTDLLFGRYQKLTAPDCPAGRELPFKPITTAENKLNLSSIDLAKVQMRDKARNLVLKLQGRSANQVLAAYD